MRKYIFAIIVYDTLSIKSYNANFWFPRKFRL